MTSSGSIVRVPNGLDARFLGTIQLPVLVILGEYVARIFDEVKHRPNWVVAQALGVQVESRGEDR